MASDIENPWPWQISFVSIAKTSYLIYLRVDVKRCQSQKFYSKHENHWESLRILKLQNLEGWTQPWGILGTVFSVWNSKQPGPTPLAQAACKGCGGAMSTSSGTSGFTVGFSLGDAGGTNDLLGSASSAVAQTFYQFSRFFQELFHRRLPNCYCFQNTAR